MKSKFRNTSPDMVKEYYSDAYMYEPLPSRFYAYFLQLLNVEKDKKLLDIACGEGNLLKEAEKVGLDCYGVDISTSAIQIAGERTKADLKCINVDDGLDYPDNFFDYITCLGSLEHFQNQSTVIREIRRVALEGARICIYVPNDNYILHKLGYETDHQLIVNRYSLKKWGQLIESNALEIENIYKDNSHLTSLNVSGNIFRRILKIIFKLGMRPILPFLPLKYSFAFIFICGTASNND